MNALSEAYRDFPLHLNQIIPIDFDSIRTVPDSHVWPDSGDFQLNDGDGLSIPTVDLREADAAKLIGHACERWGAFQVVNHGIPLKLLDEVEAEARRLFSLPVKQKLKAVRTPGEATGYGIARVSHFFNKYMWHEGFTLMGSPIDHARELWPHDYLKFCVIMEDYEKKMKDLAETLMRLIFNYLAISEEERKWVGSSSALQLNSYPHCPNPDRAMGLAPHTDTSLFTILHQSTTPGLQILNQQDDGWVSVYPCRRTLVVNVGDLLHIISNGRFVSVVHRVVMREANRQRLSVAFFYNPPTDFHVLPLVSSAQIPLYRSVSVAEYIAIKAKHFDKALSLIRF